MPNNPNQGKGGHGRFVVADPTDLRQLFLDQIRPLDIKRCAKLLKKMAFDSESKYQFRALELIYKSTAVKGAADQVKPLFVPLEEEDKIGFRSRSPEVAK